ncbi:MAG: patatin-like phospholipase family protein [Muribaculaceae bacterium]
MTNDTALESTGRKYRLGIALSGGGARGFAHAGALMAIEEAGLKPDVVAGVSAGSVVAVLYAAGVRPADIPRLFSNAGMSDFTTLSLGQGGLLSAEKFKKFVMKAIGGYTRLEDLPMPVYIGVTDFDRGVATEFHRGPIGDVMLASCSIPIVFRPVNIDGVNYVDGGVLRNHPAWILRDKCDKLIGINVSPLNQRANPSSLLDVAMRTYNLMAKANQNADMNLCDISVTTPEIAHYKVFNLKNINSVFISGYIHARKSLREAGMWNPERSTNAI